MAQASRTSTTNVIKLSDYRKGTAPGPKPRPPSKPSAGRPRELGVASIVADAVADFRRAA